MADTDPTNAYMRKQEAIRLRLQENLNNREIAEKLGVHHTTVANYVRGLPPANNVKSRTCHAVGSMSGFSNEAQAATRQEQAFELRLRGWSMAAIGRQIQIHPGKISEMIRAEIEARVQPKAAQLRAIELERLDLYLQKLQPGIDRGDEKSINAALRVAEHRARLLGIYAPVRVDATFTEVSAAEAELQQMIGEAKAKMEAEQQRLTGELPPQAE